MARWKTASRNPVGTLCRLLYESVTTSQPTSSGSASSAASILLERLRTLALKGTEAACYQAHTFRVKLLKIGAGVIRNIPRTAVIGLPGSGAVPAYCPGPDKFLLNIFQC